MGQISVRIVFRATKKWGLVFLKSDLIDVNFKCFFYMILHQLFAPKFGINMWGNRKFSHAKASFTHFGEIVSKTLQSRLTKVWTQQLFYLTRIFTFFTSSTNSGSLTTGSSCHHVHVRREENLRKWKRWKYSPYHTYRLFQGSQGRFKTLKGP